MGLAVPNGLGRAEIVRWVVESLCPFDIVIDWGFWPLMKTGRPEYFLPSAKTVARDVRQVFVHSRQRVAKLLRVSSKTNKRNMELTDVPGIRRETQFYHWHVDGTEPPSIRGIWGAFGAQRRTPTVSIRCHWSRKGNILTCCQWFDVLMFVYQLHTGVELAAAFENVLDEFKLADKVLIWYYIWYSYILSYWLSPRSSAWHAIMHPITMQWLMISCGEWQCLGERPATCAASSMWSTW